jgi:peptide/nickel transport system permease protein
MLALIVLMALAAPLLAPGDPGHIDLESREKLPSLQHLFGTDRLGRDVFARIVWGARVSLGVSLLAVSLGSLIGVLLGAIAGYTGGPADVLITRAIDVMLALPTFFLLVTIQSLFPPSALNVSLPPIARFCGSGCASLGASSPHTMLSPPLALI